MKAAVLKKEGSDDDAGSGDGVARAGPGPGRDRNAVMSASARAGRRVAWKVDGRGGVERQKVICHAELMSTSPIPILVSMPSFIRNEQGACFELLILFVQCFPHAFL